MFSRTLFRSSLRALQRPKPQASWQHSTHPESQLRNFHLPAHPFRSRLQSRSSPINTPQRVGLRSYRQFDHHAARNAKPLITADSLRNAAVNPKTKWVFILAFGSAVVFYVSNLETVPVSGRRRFNCFSDESVEEEGQRMYSMIMDDAKQAILPDWDPRVRMVKRVMERLIPASGLEDVPWEVNVIHSNGK